MSKHRTRRTGIAIQLAALNLAFAVVLSACGGGDSEEVTPPAPAPAPSVPAPAPAPTSAPPAAGHVAPAVNFDAMLRNPGRVEAALNWGAALPPPMYAVAGEGTGVALPNIDAFWRAPSPDSRTPLRDPMVVQRDGTVIYLDQVAQQLVRVKANGEVSTQPSPGRRNGEAAKGFWSPTAFTADAQGNAYVADGWYVDSTVCSLICGVSGYPLQAGIWPGVWRVSPSGQTTRLAGIVTGDGMVDGDRDTAQFSAITQMLASADGHVYVLDKARKELGQGRHEWQGFALRRIDGDGRVVTLRALDLKGRGTLFKRTDGSVGLLMIRTSGVATSTLEYDIATGQERAVDPGQYVSIRYGVSQTGWRNSIDQAGNSWLMASFVMYPPATGLQDNLRILSVNRYGADGVMRPGSMVLQWGCGGTDTGAETFGGSTCGFKQLGVTDDQQLVALLNNTIVRIDLPALPPP